MVFHIFWSPFYLCKTIKGDEKIWTTLDFYIIGTQNNVLSWTTFITPFHWSLWVSLLFLSILATIILWLLPKARKNYENISVLESFATSIAAFFGISVHDGNDLEINSSTRVSLNVHYLCGSLFLYVYVGFLTSSLAVPAGYKPFQSPDSLLKTSYRYFPRKDSFCLQVHPLSFLIML